MGKNDTRNILLFTAGVAGLVGAGVLIARARGESNGTNGQLPCRENLPIFNTIIIEDITTRIEGLNFFIFDATYRNQTCNSQDVAIIMQVHGKSGEVLSIQSRELFLGPGETKKFEWRLIINNPDRKVGGNEIRFFVWRTLDKNIILSGRNTIFI